MTKQKRVLITGGAGYNGSATVRAFLDGGYKVTVFDNLSVGQREAVDSRATFIEGDILDVEILRHVFESTQFGTVVHLAALKLVEEGECEPQTYHATNVEGTRNVLDAMKRAGVSHIIFSSSAAVYGKSGNEPYHEEMPLRPVNVYGDTKVQAEALINSYVQRGEIQTGTIFRYFNVAGTSKGFQEKEPTGLCSYIARAIKQGEKLHVFGSDYHTKDGTAVRDYMHVQDVAEANVLASGKNIGGTFNLGSGSPHSVKEVIAAFNKVAGMDIPVIFEKRRTGDVAYSCADITKVRNMLGWKPQRTLEDIIQSTLSAYH